MTSRYVPQSSGQGLAFLALLAFVASFFAARIFTTFNHNVVVILGGIHFHHFWYGLVMVVVAGWLAIASNRPEYDRVYAVVFGLGLGLIGDETGLLLTLGDYNSSLTYFAFMLIISVALLAILAARYEPKIAAEVVELDNGERAVHVGLLVCALSFLGFGFGYYAAGASVFALGLIMVGLGISLQRTRSRA